MSRGGLNISCFSTNSTAIEEAAKVLNRALAHGDTTAIMNTLGVIARERGMSHVARESLYRSTDAKGNPEFATALRVLASIGLRLEA
jgi:probable addiction module antidote protein